MPAAIKNWIENSPHKPWCHQAPDNIYTRKDDPCTCGRDAALKSVATNLDELINQATQELPKNWEINIEIQQGYAEVIITKPNGSLVHMFQDEINLTQQFQNALLYIRIYMSKYTDISPTVLFHFWLGGIIFPFDKLQTCGRLLA